MKAKDIVLKKARKLKGLKLKAPGWMMLKAWKKLFPIITE